MLAQQLLVLFLVDQVYQDLIAVLVYLAFAVFSADLQRLLEGLADFGRGRVFERGLRLPQKRHAAPCLKV